MLTDTNRYFVARDGSLAIINAHIAQIKAHRTAWDVLRDRLGAQDVIVVGNRVRALRTDAPASPAFEGGSVKSNKRRVQGLLRSYRAIRGIARREHFAAGGTPATWRGVSSVTENARAHAKRRGCRQQAWRADDES